MKLGQGRGHLVGSVSRVETVDLNVMSSNPRLSIDMILQKGERERERNGTAWEVAPVRRTKQAQCPALQRHLLAPFSPLT